jgi:phosphate starvation-inducible membrane PsiE
MIAENIFGLVRFFFAYEGASDALKSVMDGVIRLDPLTMAIIIPIACLLLFFITRHDSPMKIVYTIAAVIILAALYRVIGPAFFVNGYHAIAKWFAR